MKSVELARELDEVWAFWQNNNKSSPFVSSWSKLDFLPYLKGDAIYLVRSQENIVGLIVLNHFFGEDLEILQILVGSQFRKQGLGAALVDKVCELYQPKALILEVHSSNLNAQSFYKNRGFREFSRRKSYYKDGGDALLLRKEAN